MLNPSMQDLMKKINNRYLIVNVAAQRARDIAEAEEEAREREPKEKEPKTRFVEKSIKIALDEIAEGKIEYREGPRPEPATDDSEMMEAAAGTIESADDLLAEAAAPETHDDTTEEL